MLQQVTLEISVKSFCDDCNKFCGEIRNEEDIFNISPVCHQCLKNRYIKKVQRHFFNYLQEELNEIFDDDKYDGGNGGDTVMYKQVPRLLKRLKRQNKNRFRNL